MIDIKDKLIILICCFFSYILYSYENLMPIHLIIAIIIISMQLYFNIRILNFALLILFVSLCFFYIEFTLFLPVIIMHFLLTEKLFISLLALTPVITSFNTDTALFMIMVLVFSVLSYLIRHRSVNIELIKEKYIKLRDEATSISMTLETKNKELLEKHDYEINLATLNERNRIAVELHDSLGHLITSAILQIGALKTICNEDNINNGLTNIKDTLLKGMGGIRKSIHDLHDESIDLHIEVKKIVDEFTFCKIALKYKIETMINKKIKYCIIAVLKEAMSNIIKHSDATCVDILLLEHPAFIQLIINDNGRKKHISNKDGIGLKNMQERVRAINGNINITNDNGFRIFISIPKEGV